LLFSEVSAELQHALFRRAAHGRFLVNAATYRTVPEQSEAALPIQQRC
jgi:hypothetical protein